MNQTAYLTTPDGLRLFQQKTGSGSQALVIPNGFYLGAAFERLAESRMLIVYDARNRGRSDESPDPSALTSAIHQDAEDLETVRRESGAEKVDLMAHSYSGWIALLYAMKYPHHVRRIVLIGVPAPDPAKKYPAELMGDDGVLAEVMAKLAALQKDLAPGDPAESCRRFWRVLRELYVVNPADAEKIDWGRCELTNELKFLTYWRESLDPSIRALRFSADALAGMTAQVLIVHGVRDRNVPYGGARDWVSLLPHARLLSVENAAHAPWIEAPELVFGGIATFLGGDWPDTVSSVVLR